MSGARPVTSLAGQPLEHSPSGPQSSHKNSVMKIACCTALITFSISSTLFTEASKNIDGSYPYNTTMIPCAVEGLKLLTSGVILLAMKVLRTEPLVLNFSLSSFLLYSLPAFCYFVSNNCMFYIIKDLGPTTFQIMNNLKVFTTGILMQIFLKRYLSSVRWKALCILVIGSMVSQIGGRDASLTPKFTSYVYVLVNSFTASAGGVISEKLLKGSGRSDSIHWQNAQLYFFGLVFGLLSSAKHINTNGALFHGFNIWAVATVASLSICGLLVSFILKYLDNFAKCFIQSVCMLLVAVIHAATRGEFLQLHHILAICLVCLAIDQYHLPQ